MTPPIDVPRPEPRIELKAPAVSNEHKAATNQNSLANQNSLTSIFDRIVERSETTDLSACDFRPVDLDNLVMYIQKCLTTIYHAIQRTTPQKMPRLSVENYDAAHPMQKRWWHWLSDRTKYNHAPERLTLRALGHAQLETMVKDLLSDLMHRTMIWPGSGVEVVPEPLGRFDISSML